MVFALCIYYNFNSESINNISKNIMDEKADNIINTI